MSSIIKVPNIGDFKEVEIIEVLVKNGDNINKGDPVITLESDKSSVEVPSTFSGKIININVKIGDKVSEGDTILEIDSGSDQVEVSKKSEEKITEKENQIKQNIAPNKQSIISEKNFANSTGASPNTLKFARELGININELQGSGRGGRVKEEDIKNFIKNKNSTTSSAPQKKMMNLICHIDILNLVRLMCKKYQELKDYLVHI